ncbi:ATP-binding protein [Candidatus Woesearchaeota archaeon]|nr:ATP-binding protein [Candidatus Woesearchaeota archaeon]
MDKNILIRVMHQWNIWWERSSVPSSKVAVPRAGYLASLSKKLERKEIISLVGVRRSGKSTLLYQLIDYLISERKVSPKNILYINLDNPVLARFLEEENSFESLLDVFKEENNPSGKSYIFLDEIQALDGWQRWLKKYYDLQNENMKFVVSGSTSSIIESSLSTLLSGRYLKEIVYPLSFREFLDFKGIKPSIGAERHAIIHHFRDFMRFGGFPEVVLEKEKGMKSDLLKEYYNTILFRDMIERYSIRNISKFKDWFYYVLTNCSRYISYNKVSKLIGVSDDTVKEYLDYSERSFLTFALRAYSYSLRASLSSQKPKKVYIIDTGLANAVGFRFSSDKGHLFENIAYLHMKQHPGIYTTGNAMRERLIFW